MMEKGLALLQSAQHAMSANPMLESAAKENITTTLMSAKESIQQASGRYRGHRVKAMEYIAEAIADINGDDKGKATTFVMKAIQEVREGISVAK